MPIRRTLLSRMPGYARDHMVDVEGTACFSRSRSSSERSPGSGSALARSA